MVEEGLVVEGFLVVVGDGADLDFDGGAGLAAAFFFSSATFSASPSLYLFASSSISSTVCTPVQSRQRRELIPRNQDSKIQIARTYCRFLRIIMVGETLFAINLCAFSAPAAQIGVPSTRRHVDALMGVGHSCAQEAR